jgi:hypothetical protein
MKKIIALLVISMFTLSSCKKEAQEVTEESETVVADTALVATDSAVVASDAMIQPMQPDATGANPNTIMNQNPGTTMPQTSTTVQQVAPVKVAKGMNPAHGQAGHRCDIAVGAPLNSPAGKTPVASQTSKPTTISSSSTPGIVSSNGATITTTQSTPTPMPMQVPAAATAPGMNPPHGQEGHVCSVAVGAPLPKP